MRLSIAMGVVVSLLVTVEALTQETPKDAVALEGTWKLVAGEADGIALLAKERKGGKLIIKGENYTVTLAGRGTAKGIQKLDPAKKPKTIDIMDVSGPNKGKTYLGIYELKGDEFRVVFAPLGKARPTKFATAPESGQWMHVWERVKQ